VVKRLIREITNTDPTVLPDLVLVMAMNIETSLIETGATPGQDYTVRDLFNWATPFALEVFKKDDQITYLVSS